jgi:hypothetical protein
VIIDASIENELKDQKQEKEVFRTELGGKDDGIDSLIKAGYRLLNITYFTTGEDETRACFTRLDSTCCWSSDTYGFKDKFIRAEVVHCDLLNIGGYGPAREKERCELKERSTSSKTET